MIDWYKKVVFENYANFKGRARRSEYWYFALMNLIIAIITIMIDRSLGLKFGLNSIYGLLVFIPGQAVLVRRFHDIGKSGKLLLLFYLITFVLTIVMVASGVSVFLASMNPNSMSPAAIGSLGLGFFIPVLLIVAMVIWMLILLFTEGDRGANKYGPDPKAVDEEINEIGLE